MAANQTPEQLARDHIDAMLIAAGWIVQPQKQLNLKVGLGVAVTEVQTDAGIADYVLFINAKPVGIIEAKREEAGQHLTQVEEQSASYAQGKIKHLKHQPLPFVYESTGALTRFTDYRDPKPRSRPVFHFHRPETLAEWLGQASTLRKRLQLIPALNPENLRPAQLRAIVNVEQSFKENRPRALIQMATGAGKTFTACTFVYRLLRYADAKRVLFLVDTKNLGEQAEQEFLKFQPNDDNRKFTELYNVQRLRSSYIASDSQVCISTIQRLYSILKGEELDEALEQDNPNEVSSAWQKQAPLPLEYTPKNPIEQFDFIIIDECHRSIYNLWRQVLEYYDAFLIGLTATPDQRTFGFFNQNVVSEYSFEESVADGVNVPYDVFLIETEITQQGAKLKAKQLIEKREKLSRKKRWEHLDDELNYKPSALDKEVVNPSTIRAIIQTVKRSLPQIFPDRFDVKGEFEVPKTLIFAKTDSHANDIIDMVREEFAEGNDFCKKITYQADEDPKSVLNRFRNSWNPRIAVTVDMIATGTDVKPLEVLLFMRDVKSSNYFEQMKGRGTRSISFDDLQKASQTAKHTKTHFVIMDAVGATKSRKTASRSLERKPTTSLKELLIAVAFGNTEEDLLTTLANRLMRLNRQLQADEQAQVVELSVGQSLTQLIKQLLNAYDPDVLEARTQALLAQLPKADRVEVDAKAQAQEALAQEAVQPFNAELNTFLVQVQQVHEQVMDTVNQDTVTFANWDKTKTDNARQVVQAFEAFLLVHRDEITALQIFYNQPYRRREVTFAMVKDLLALLKREKPLLSPHYVWEAYAQLDQVQVATPAQELVTLVSLLRRVTGLDGVLMPFGEQVNRNFQRWILQQNAGQHNKFSVEQVEWLRMLRDHVASSFHVEVDDLDYTPFDGLGGRGRMWQLFGEEMGAVMDELNEVLVA
ncbi:DEAD/DEAH box helicase family protein [uncultured Thiothrix sp.]|uniref:type I restriction endonuclease subunit R n=1 Tax=uncultured Thiothrix sp. TaxID=223185 RepID=UPI0026225E31|nr:DEAD/DEAH box helicase family protein [uncultured Thiothrix sp.]HMT94314.1 type I restriction-modification enzyme R subunit C-terminal domain-containing protein [Thiolinea sp.]